MTRRKVLIAAAMASAGQALAQQTTPPTGGRDAQGARFREPDPLDFEDHAGYASIFDGTSWKNWVGNPAIWRVESGAIVGESTLERPTGNSYISYHGATAKDFDLKLEIKVENGGGSGIQYRSHTGLPENTNAGRAAGPNGAQPPRDP